MSDKKHIDRLFQEKFKDFEVAPDPAVWENIQLALHEDKRKRRVVPFWWKLSGVAAALVLLFGIGNAIFNTDETLATPETKVVDTKTTQSETQTLKGNEINKTETSLIINDTTGRIIIANLNTSRDTVFRSAQDYTKKEDELKLKRTNTIAGENSSKENGTEFRKQKNRKNPTSKNKSRISTSNEETVAKNSSNLPQLNSDRNVTNDSKKTDKFILEGDKEYSKIADLNSSEVIVKASLEEVIESLKETENIEEAIAKANPTNEEEKEEHLNRWNITPNVAPVYFNSLGQGSTIDDQFVNNSKSGEVNMSYGISGSYAINNKIKLRAGINKVNLGYSTNNVIAFRDINSFNSNSKRQELQTINFSARGVADSYISTSSINAISAPQFVLSNAEGSLEQQFGYIEVPLEVEYSIINSKFGLNVIGGFSTLFLNNNDVFSVSENERFLLGEANNINRTSYSANFGLGFDYNISHHLKLNLEPMFKYQINTFNNTSGEFRPYFIGVYTGFSFKF